MNGTIAKKGDFLKYPLLAAILFFGVFLFLSLLLPSFKVDRSEPPPAIFTLLTQSGLDESVASDAETKIGMANPAAVYCSELGYEYKIADTEKGQKGLCVFPDKSQCEGWQFLKGKCGKAYSYCAREGYDLIVKTDGNDPFSKHYAVCVHRQKEIGSVAGLVSLSKKATRGSFSVEQSLSTLGGEVSTESSPSLFDWKNYQGQDWMTPVKDQGSCGSCWAFSAVGIVEAVYNIGANDPNLDLDLSEQYLVSDCHTKAGLDQNCCGGAKLAALNFIKNSGIPNEECMQYIDGYLTGCTCGGDSCDASCNYRIYPGCSDKTCSDRCSNWEKRLIKIDNVNYISPDPAAIKQYLVDKGPLAVSIGIGSHYGGYWDGDIYRCTNDLGANHAVIITGYDDAGGYWIVKNSWGTNWGEEGYFRVGYGECAIENSVNFVEPDRKDCGESINSDTVLVNDLSCLDVGLYVESDVTLDCHGHTIDGNYPYQGSNNKGIYLQTGSGAIVKNCNLREFYSGIFLAERSNSNIIGNTIEDSKYGIHLYWSSNNNLIGNTLYSNDDGIAMEFASNNDITDNDFIENNYYGVSLWGDPSGPYSSNNTTWNNRFIDNGESASEGGGATNSNWDLNEVGNYWSDFPYNIGYSEYYAVSGPGNGIDHHPLNDDDRDGIRDYIDNCPTVYNPDQNDTDSDDIGDACDNCWYVPNPDQLDSNGNCPAPPYETDPQCGDVCEVSEDLDGDGVPGTEDNCPDVYNPDQLDTDNDGLGDACDPDDDNDGCTDQQELVIGFDPLNWCDFYDVPAPVYPDPTLNGTKDCAVTMGDVLAVLFYVGTYEGGPPNANGVDYDSDKNQDGIPDGRDYDRSPGPLPNPPWDASCPDGAVSMSDVLAVLAQVGLDCSGP